MRVVGVVGLAVLILADSAFAADLGPILRGGQYEEPVLAPRWAGIYGGGQVGFSTAAIDFSHGVGTLIADELRVTAIEQDFQVSNWPNLPKKNPIGASYGAFLGYNCQWDEIVVGWELNYNRTSLSASSDDSISRSLVDSNGLPQGHHYYYNVTVGGTGSAHITDWGTLRFRAAWAVDAFLPYAFVGLAVGRTDVSRTGFSLVSAQDVPDPPQPGSPPITPLPNIGPDFASEGSSQKGVYAYGGAVGLGVDVALLPNYFVRAEWEFVQFAPVKSDRIHIDTVRTAIGMKF